MSTLALTTTTMLQPVTNSPLTLLGQSSARAESKPQLPSKRKRDDLCRLGTSNRPFTIKPYPDSPYEKPATFKPVRVIARSQLPLTLLDTSTIDKFATNSLFFANIEVLEQHAETKESEHPSVLIAQLERTQALYAVERVQARVYSLCKLASWLKEKEIAYLWDPSTIAVPVPVRASRPLELTTGDWWQHAAVETHVYQQPVKRARVTMMRTKPLPKHPDVEVTEDILDPVGTVQASSPSEVSLVNLNEPIIVPPTPEEHLDSLIQQYLDAVYLSKTSLAYFAKGPITRIRNVFTSADEGAPQTHELVTFMRAMLLSPKASEKKYYEKLPMVVKSLPPGSFSDEEAAAVPSKPKRSKKKQKLNRDGVYPHEDTFIKRWWWTETRAGSSMSRETNDEHIKRRIGELRVRETLAQLMLMLEIIALETLCTKKTPPDEQTLEGDTQTQGGTGAKPKKRKKKLDDVNVQLDLLLDKLCIWHATEEAGILDFDAKLSKQVESLDINGKSAGSDRLHSFCVEVIVPFYVNRLPEQAVMVNKKLGGPAHQLSSKRKAMRPPTTSRKSGDSKEPDTKKSRRSLARVATDTTGKTTDRITPSLHRSATDSALLNGIKREGSEVPLSAIPFRRSPSKDSRRSMSQIRHLQGRQIDLGQPSAAASAKMKQKQRVEEDLQDAISALKKPNRGLAAGSYMADIEQRGLCSTSKSRKPANPMRKIVKDIQVSATPRVGRRTKNMIEQTPRQPDSNPFVRSPADAPASSNFWVPSSGVRPSSSTVPATAHRSAAAGRSLVQTGIAETPSKAPNTKTFSSGATRRSIFATPSKVNSPSTDRHIHNFQPPIFETPVKAAHTTPPSKPNFTLPAVEATPIKSMPLFPSMKVAHGPIPSATADAEPSIYDALGWNDDDDDDEMS